MPAASAYDRKSLVENEFDRNSVVIWAHDATSTSMHLRRRSRVFASVCVHARRQKEKQDKGARKGGGGRAIHEIDFPLKKGASARPTPPIANATTRTSKA